MIPQVPGTAALMRKLRADKPGADDNYAKLIAEIERLEDRCHELADALRPFSQLHSETVALGSPMSYVTRYDIQDAWIRRARKALPT